MFSPCTQWVFGALSPVSTTMGASDDDGDGGSTPHESSGDEEDIRFQQKVEKSETAFTEYRIGEASLSNLRADVLQAICRARDLEMDGSRSDLAK